MADIPFRMGDERATIASAVDVNGTKVYVGHSMTAIQGSVADAQANYPGAVKDGKLMTYSFDRETMAKSRVASMFQSQAVSPTSINEDMLRNVQQMRASDVKFTDYDRGLIQAIRDDFQKRTPQSAQDPNYQKAMTILDQMSTAVAPAPTRTPVNAPNTASAIPAATGPVQQPARAPEGPLPRPLTAAENAVREEYDIKHGTLMSSLTPQQKTLYDAYLVAPTEPGRISAAETRFSISLSIDQLNLFDKVRKLQDQIKNGVTLVAAPAGATPPTVPVDPNRPIVPPPAAPATTTTAPPSVVPLPTATDPGGALGGEIAKLTKALGGSATAPKEGDPNFVGPPSPQPFVGPPAPKFELSMEAGGKYTVNPQVQAAQQIMADLKKAGVAGIELGATGANKDGVDGKFGPKTRDSIIAVEKALGIDPPTGKLTTDLVDKMKAKAQELAAKPAATAAVPGAPNFVGPPAPAATPTPTATPTPAVTAAPVTTTTPASTTTTIPASTVTATPAVTTPPVTTAAPPAPTPPTTLSTTTTAGPPAPPAAAATTVTAGPPAPKPLSEAQKFVSAIRDELRATPQGREIDDKKMSGQQLTLEDRQFLQDVYDRHGGPRALEAAKARDAANGFQKVSNTYDPIMDYLSDFDLTGTKKRPGQGLMYADTSVPDPDLVSAIQNIKYVESLKGDPKANGQNVASLVQESGSDAKLDPAAIDGLDLGNKGFDRGLPGAKLPTMSA